MPLRPMPDELLSSWLFRLADAHGLNLHSFCVLVWPGKTLWSRDVDRSADHDVISTLVRRTGASLRAVHRTLLSAYEGVLFAGRGAPGSCPWVLPMGISYWVQRRFGLQFCPTCLAEDRVPYFRRKWRLACSTLCIRHSTPLLDRCPACGSPVNLYRGERERGAGLEWAPIIQCRTCRTDLREAPAGAAGGGLSATDIRVQREIDNVIRRGWIQIAGCPVYSHLFFAGLRQLGKVFTDPRGGMRLFAAACDRYGEPQPDTSRWRKCDIERLGCAERRLLLRIAIQLIEDWPDALVELCRGHQVWSSILLRDMREKPYWYASVAREQLSSSPSSRER